MPTNLQAATSTTGAVLDPSAGDGQLVIKTGATAGAQVNALSFAADGTPTFLKTPAITTPNTVSMIRLTTNNGYGSTNNKIGRFLTTLLTQGSDITYADSATLGASFTINANGVYAFSASIPFNASSDCGLSLNTTAPTTAVWSLPLAEVLLAANQANNALSWTGYLVAGSVVRPHYGGGALSTNPAWFTVVRVA